MARTRNFQAAQDASKDRIKILIVLLLIIVGYTQFAPKKAEQRSHVVATTQK
jgi:uncharacterized membrane protein YkgB